MTWTEAELQTVYDTNPVVEVWVWAEAPGQWGFQLFDHTGGVSAEPVSAGLASSSQLPSAVSQALHAAIGAAIPSSAGTSG